MRFPTMTCPFCGKHKGSGNHSKCSKEIQDIKGIKCENKSPRKTLTTKDVEFLSKSPK